MRDKIECGRLDLELLSAKELERIWSGKQDFLVSSVLSEVIKSAVKHKMEQMQMTPEEAHPWLSYWLIKKQDDGSGIGLIGCKNLPDEAGYVELGYAVAKEHQNQGYMTEALEGFLDWLYTHPFCNGAWLRIRPKNKASEHVAKKCGFAYEGIQEAYGIYRYHF